VTYEDFLSELARAGLTVRAFSELVGKNPNSITNYARAAELPDHLAIMAVLISELSVLGVDFRHLLSKIELKRKKPRGAAKRGQFGGDRQVTLDLEP
jgi:hypothetical protein